VTSIIGVMLISSFVPWPLDRRIGPIAFVKAA
jgi:hypothetical protein